MKQPKTILFKIWKFPLLSETFILNQVVLSLKLGYDVKILVAELEELSNANSDLIHLYNIQEKIILEKYKIPKQRLIRYLKAGRLILKNILLMPLLIKYYYYSSKKGLLPLFEFFFFKDFRDIDVIHIQFGTNKHPIDLLKKVGLIKSKLVVSFHGHDLEFPINNLIPNNGYYRILFKGATHLIANTRYMEEKLLTLRAPKIKIKVIPVTVDTKIFKFSGVLKNTSKVKLITVGRLDELKGQRYGILATNALIQKGYDIEYEIYGSGHTHPQLINLVQELNLSDRITLKGAVDNRNLPSILREADIFLMTSITTKRGSESQGLVTAEAQASGVPVIAFDTGGVKYTFKDGETGFLCIEKDVNCMAEKIELLINDTLLREEMGINGREFVEKEFSELSVMNKWRDIYG